MAMEDSDPCHRPALGFTALKAFPWLPFLSLPCPILLGKYQSHKYRLFPRKYPWVCINPYSTPTSRNHLLARYRKSHISFSTDFWPWLNNHELPPTIFFSFPTPDSTVLHYLAFLQGSSGEENELKKSLNNQISQHLTHLAGIWDQWEWSTYCFPIEEAQKISLLVYTAFQNKSFQKKII